jgi:RNA-directed DNA polymerase
MDEKRQNNQLKLTFTTLRRGEAPSRNDLEGTEALMVAGETENPAVTERMMEEMLELENLKRALKKVMQNKGAPGIDGMTVKELPGYLKEHWSEIRKQLLTGKYAPRAVKRVEIPKPGSHKKRKLGIPRVVDRFIQQAMLQVLQKNWDPTFSEHSYGFRPGRSQHQAVQQAQKYVSSGLRWVVDFDLEQFLTESITTFS